MPSVLTIDQGTTGSTALVLSEDGRILGRAYSEFKQHYPRPGWVEHDANEIWEVTRAVATEALVAAGGEADVRALGITNQRETIVVWDRSTGEPVHRAIVWQDRRTAEMCRRLIEEGHEADIRRRTGLVVDPYFSATKLTWLLESDPTLRSRAEAGELAAGTIDSWLVHRLSGGRAHVTDPTNASRTLLYDIDALAWDDHLLSLFGVPRALLPEVRPSSSAFAVSEGSALGTELPILGIAGDQQSALFGQGCWHPGLAKQTFGTGAFLLLNTGAERVESKRGLLTTVACGPRGEPAYALEGSIFIAGAAVQWLRDELKLITTAAETEELARSLASNEGVYLVPGFVGLGAPHWNAEARGAILGLTRGAGRAHFARAALEAMAYATREVLDAMVSDSGIDAQELRVDGGAAMNDWMLEFLAGIIDRTVRRPALVETTALGAAGLAGLAAGVWRDADHFLESRAEPTIFQSTMTDDERRSLMDGWRNAVRAVQVFAGNEASSVSGMPERHESGPIPGERPLRIAVSGSGLCDTSVATDAEAVGRAIAEAGAVLITGGRSGVMEAACRGAASAGGVSIGFLPGGEGKEANPWVTVPIPTGMGQGRNFLVARAADALIAVDGGWGTLSEVALARKLEIPVVLLRPALTANLGLPLAETAQEAVQMALRLGRSRRAPGVAH